MSSPPCVALNLSILCFYRMLVAAPEVGVFYKDGGLPWLTYARAQFLFNGTNALLDPATFADFLTAVVTGQSGWRGWGLTLDVDARNGR